MVCSGEEVSDGLHGRMIAELAGLAEVAELVRFTGGAFTTMKAEAWSDGEGAEEGGGAEAGVGAA